MQGPDTDLAIVLDGVSDAFFTIDNEWRFTYLNPEAERILARGDLLGKELPETVGLPLYRELYRAVQEQTTVEFRQHHPSLDTWFEIRAYPLQSGLAVSFRDVNARQKEWQRLMERALEASSAGALITDAARPDNPIIYANRALQRMTGYPEEKMLGHNCRFLQSGDRDQSELDGLREAIENGREWKGVLRNYRKDGALFYNELHISSVRGDDGRITHHIGIQNDVTARIESRERDEETLRRQSAAMESSMDGIGISRADGSFIYLNQAHADLYDYESPEGLIGKTWRDLYSQEWVSWFERNVIPILVEEGRWRGEAVGVRRGGSEFPQELSLTVLEDGGTVCVVHDITERRRAERALADSESRLAEAQSVAGVGSCEWNLVDGSLTWSREKYRIFGVDPARFQVSVEALLDLVHSDDRDLVRDSLRRSAHEGGVTEQEYRIVRPDGEMRVILSRRRAERDERGEPVRVLSTVQDVTERRRDEEAHLRLSSIVEHSEEAIVANTLDGTLTSGNPAAERLFGYTAEEMIGESVGILNPEEKPEENLQKIRGIGRTGAPDIQETVRVAKDGTRIEVSVTASPIRDAAGNVTGTSAIYKDISNRKVAERALAESEARFRNLVELSPDAIAVHSEGIIVYINPAGARLLGAEHPEEIRGRSVMSLVHPDHRDVARYRMGRIQTEGVHAEPLEEKFLRLDGSSVNAEVAGLPITYEGRPAVQILARDITERKLAEEALRQSEERYRAIVEDQSEMICRFSPDMTITFVNDAYCKYFGVERESLLGTSFMSLIPEKEQRPLEEQLFNLSTGAPTKTTEHRATAAGGEIRWHQWTDRALFDERGELAGFQAVGRDITGRKRAEEALQRERNLLRTVMDTTHDAILSKDTEHRFRLSNAAHQRCMGAVSEDELLGKTDADYWGEEAAGPFHEEDRRVLDTGESIVNQEKRLPNVGGNEGEESAERYISTTKVPLRASDGTIEGLVAVVRDITERRREHKALVESERLLRAVTRNAPVVLFATDREGMVTLAEGKALDLIHLEPDAVVGKSIFEVCTSLPQVLDNVRRALTGEEVAARVELSGLAFEFRYSPMSNGEGTVTGAIGVATDVTARRELEKELEHRAFHDSLTDLPNRALFIDRLEHALKRTSRSGEQVAVLFLDLDDFKHVNDSMGHSAGDRLLVAAGRRISSCLRDEDTVARLGGDEFAVLLGAVPEPGFPTQMAQRIAEELRHPVTLTSDADIFETEREVIATTSVGIALSGPEDRVVGAEELLQRADSALYRAKETGKDHHEPFCQEMKDRSAKVLRVGRELHLALERDEFILHYQPKTSLNTGEIVGLEALARWEHPERGLVYPDEFIPLSEENGLIVPLGRSVLHEACRQAKKWQSLHPNGPPIKISVNLSARQLQAPDFFEDVSRALSGSELHPSSLVLEITESVLIRQNDHGTSTLHKLKELGVKLAIDDFGSGYSSLSYLKDLPVDILKIDRSLVSGMGSDPAKAAIVSASIALAHTLGLLALAEGVEEASELEELRRLGCDVGQGYYWSRPLPASEATVLL